MPRVVPDQKTTFESDEFFRKLSRECEVRYTGFRDRPMDERQLRFQAECREGHADVAFVCTGTTLQLNFSANSWSERPEDRVLTSEYVDFDSEPGKVHLKSQFILNGVCVLWRGYIDLTRLDGVACLEFDRERAEVEARILRDQIEENSRRVQEFEDHRLQQIQLDQERQERQERLERREMQASSEAEVVEALLRFSEAPQGGNSSSCSSSSSSSVTPQPSHLQHQHLHPQHHQHQHHLQEQHHQHHQQQEQHQHQQEEQHQPYHHQHYHQHHHSHHHHLQTDHNHNHHLT
ncbi:hypothetical protein EGW08_002929 [Elysia chlorotica]|uniref:Core-binding factor subunit beta n=1 Tax=Elysia chlorotica TaxID=188477 RepID=A0A433U667_ELYCH|nr:hypothetical protein EGW08_002929 [Elysia chlorotica]